MAGQSSGLQLSVSKRAAAPTVQELSQPSTLHCADLLCSFKTKRSCVLSKPVYSFLLQSLCYLGKRSLCFLTYFYFTIFIYVLIFELPEGTRTWFFILLIYLYVQCVFLFRQFFNPQHFFIAKFIFWGKKG